LHELLLLEVQAGSGGGVMKDQVAVIGVGCTRFGDNFDQSYEEMVVEAAYAAFADARIAPERIDAAWLGTYSPYGGTGKAAGSIAAQPPPARRPRGFAARIWRSRFATITSCSRAWVCRCGPAVPGTIHTATTPASRPRATRPRRRTAWPASRQRTSTWRKCM